jgi:hypothetical protein
MTTLVFSNDKGVRVTYKTDLLKGNEGLFTVLTTEGLTDTEKGEGLDFQSLVYDLAAFKTFAHNHNLKLERINVDNTTEQWDYTDHSGSQSVWP